MASMTWNIHGHDWAVAMLRQHIANGKLRHAYLFSGSDGVGRRTLALRFAQAVNCDQISVLGEACGECITCRQIERMQHADLAVVQAEEAAILKVEQIRELQHFVALAPYASQYRVALILDFEQANASAQNALLKTLEEPNPNVLLLVTVDDAENLLPTIISRCELMRLRPMQVGALTSLLMERYSLNQTDADLYAHLAGGRVGYAFRLAENPDLLEQRKQWMADLLQLIAGEKNERIAYSRKHTSTRYIVREKAKAELSIAIPYWLSFWRDVMLMATGSNTALTNIDMEHMITNVAGTIRPVEAANAIRGLEQALTRLQSANLQLMLDNVLLDWPVGNLQ
jgi:DNA polymerase III subunit delta'